MLGFTPLFESIVASTIWSEDAETRVVWITMLALKNKDHVVEGSVPGLARLAGVSLEKTQKALAIFKAPDKFSRNQACAGRRVQDIPGGWLIINGAEYQSKMMKMKEQARWAKAQATRRAKKLALDSGPPPGMGLADAMESDPRLADHVAQEIEEIRVLNADLQGGRIPE